MAATSQQLQQLAPQVAVVPLVMSLAGRLRNISTMLVISALWVLCCVLSCAAAGGVAHAAVGHHSSLAVALITCSAEELLQCVIRRSSPTIIVLCMCFVLCCMRVLHAVLQLVESRMPLHGITLPNKVGKPVAVPKLPLM
jgi:hypothetical protein